MSKAGYDRAFLDSALLPDWWDKSCDSNPELVADIEIRVARFLGLSLREVQTASALVSPSYANARLKRATREGVRQPEAAIHAALSIARAVLRALKHPLPPVSLPPSATEWHASLQKLGGPNLSVAVADLWSRGVPVIHLGVLPSPKFQGLACLIDGRPVIVIGHDIDAPAHLLSDVLHEVGHIVHGDCEEGAPVVDEDYEANDRSQMEVAADRYAFEVALGDSPPAPPPAETWGDVRAVAQKAVSAAQETRLDVDSLIWFWATRAREYAAGTRALKAVSGLLGGKQVLRAKFDEYVEPASVSDTDQALLRCVMGEPSSAAPL